MAIELDRSVFARRAATIMKGLSTPLVTVVGSADDSLSYQKSTALQTWLLGYEFPDTAMLATSKNIVFVTSAKKGAILEALDSPHLVVLKRSKDELANAEVLKQFLKLVPEEFGAIPKDQSIGKFAQEYKDALASRNQTDASLEVAAVFASKDSMEIKIMQESAGVTSLVVKNYFIDQMSEHADSGKKITHAKFTSGIESSLLDERKRLKLKLPSHLVADLTEWCYPPIVQSGGRYDLKPSAASDEHNLHAGTIICALGVRYKSYCSNIARTYLINPEPVKEKNYTFLLALQKHMINELIKPEVACNVIYNSALEYVESNRPDLVPHLTKNFGFGMGIEFRESALLISPKNSRPVPVDAVLNLAIGFVDLHADKNNESRTNTYSLFLADTIHVTPERCILMTEVDSSLAVISYSLGEESESDAANGVEESAKKSRGGVVLSKKLRSDSNKNDNSGHEAKRKAHQKQLADARQEAGLAKYAGSADGTELVKPKATFRKFESYRNELAMPKNINELRIIVDRRNETIILPIYGQAVPFHVSMLKNVTKSDEQDCVLLRFNFISPGIATGTKTEIVYEDPNATFVRALSYRGTDIGRLTEICRDINELKKEMTKREAARVEKSGLVDQEDLVEIKGRRPLRLTDVFTKPQIESKRYPGDLEIHTNGLRFQSQAKSDQRIDILFSNIKHFFFQPCDGETVIIVHIHLHDSIIVGKKKTNDVQFYREVSDASFDETGNRRRRANYGDEDELAQEQEERRHRQSLNREFQQFSERVSDSSKKVVSVDIPFRELGFMGVPHRQLVLLQPTTDCLIHLTENPPLVVTLADVEAAHLERVQFGLKHFDMVLVFKDFSKPVVHINTIPIDQLENVKDFLDSVDICTTEGPVNLSWPQIMKTINEDPKVFFEDGGWSFMAADDGDNGSETESEESEFAAGGASGSDASESSSDDDSEFSENSSGSSSASDAQGSGAGSDAESGEDWDTLEKKAALADQRKREREGDDADEKKRVRR